MAKHAECAAAMSSSGLVAPAASSAARLVTTSRTCRDGKLVSSTLPEPSSRVPVQPVRAVPVHWFSRRWDDLRVFSFRSGLYPALRATSLRPDLTTVPLHDVEPTMSCSATLGRRPWPPARRRTQIPAGPPHRLRLRRTGARLTPLARSLGGRRWPRPGAEESGHDGDIRTAARDAHAEPGRLCRAHRRPVLRGL